MDKLTHKSNQKDDYFSDEVIACFIKKNRDLKPSLAETAIAIKRVFNSDCIYLANALACMFSKQESPSVDKVRELIVQERLSCDRPKYIERLRKERETDSNILTLKTKG